MTGARQGEPFVSGLPGGAQAPAPAVDTRGLERLAALRERAEADMRSLKPLTEIRFDGVERIEPDEEDIAAFRAAADTKRLIDLIVSDRALAVPIARVAGSWPR